MNSVKEMKIRRHWFDSYLASGNINGSKMSICGAYYTCPCCGYQTLIERGINDICPLCNWEDDGQDDPNADKIFGGLNGDYSLTQARHNFGAHFVIHSPQEDTRIGGPDTDTALAAKRLVVHAFDQMDNTNDLVRGQLCIQIEEGLSILESEVQRRIREFEGG